MAGDGLDRTGRVSRTTVGDVNGSGQPRHRVRIVGVAAVALALTACGDGTEVTSSTAAPAPTIDVTLPATTDPTEATSPPTTAVITLPPTTVPATTAPPTTEPPPTTVPPPTTTAPTGPTTAFVAADNQLLEVDVASGETVRVLVDSLSGDGVFRGGLRLSPDRSTIWFDEGYEDGWYGCDSSIGSVGRIDAATGAIDVLGLGSGVEPSANGELISYVTSSLCLPDPENPEFFVLTPYDRVVVRQLSTGEEREFVTDTPPDTYDSPSAVQGAGFSPAGDLLVLLGDGRLINVDINGSAVIQDHPVALPEVVGGPVAATADALITVEFGDEGSSDLYSIDAGSGAPTLLASSGAFMAVGVSADDQIVVASFEPVTVAPGANVTVVELPGDPFVYDIDW